MPCSICKLAKTNKRSKAAAQYLPILDFRSLAKNCMAISYATIQWIVKCCSTIQSGLEAMGATVTALYGKKSYEGVIVSLGKPTDLLLNYFSFPRLISIWITPGQVIALIKKIDITFNKT